ncbi:hypothetical protein JCM3263A_24670 [Thermobifida fusca]
MRDGKGVERRKSSYSGGTGGSFVEVAVASRYSEIRDSKNREMGHLEFPAVEWTAFLDTAKRNTL